MINNTDLNAGVESNQNKIGLIEKISYGMGDFASNAMWGVVGSFLLFYYTDIALIPVAATGTIFLVARVLDAFIDPVIGAFIDRTNSRWGRTKPYIIFGIIPFCILVVLSFTTTGGSDTVKIIYAYATYIVAGILYSVVNIPYGALMPLMTRDSNEKTQLSSFRMSGMALGNILVAACTMPLVGFFGQGDQQKGFIYTTIFISIIGAISFMILTKNCKERYVEPVAVSKEKVSMMKVYKNALKNSPWVVTILFSLIIFIKIGVTIAITVYFCLLVFKSPAMISILLPSGFIAIIICSVFTPAYLKKFKKRKGNIIALVIFIAAFAILPFFESNIPVFIGIYFFANIVGNIGAISVLGMIADSVDYNEWKFGQRSEGTLYAGYSFASKIGGAIGGAAVGYLLAFTGYDAKNVTDSVVHSINVIYFALPIVCSILQLIIMSFYKLDDMHPQIVKELNERRA